MSVTLTIDGKRVTAKEGQTILQAAQEAGIHIPTLCYHPALPPDGNCRLCVVEIEGRPGTHTSCTTKAEEGMVVRTHTPQLEADRKLALELILSEHPLDCMTCEAAGECELQDLAYEYGATGTLFPRVEKNFPVDDPNPFIQVDLNKCILCGRCVRACEYINGVQAIGFFNRGHETYIGFGLDTTMEESPCEFCGNCVNVCPTQALWPKQAIGKGRRWELEKVRTTCAYCGVGCQFYLNVKDNEIVDVTPAWDAPANHGATCVKGRFGFDFVNHPDRLTTPLVRPEILQERGVDTSGRKQVGRFVEASWDEALDVVVDKFTHIWKESGSRSIAVFGSAKCTNEENYLVQKLARQIWGTNHVDHCARLCHASTVAAMLMVFGSGAMTNSIDDVVDEAQSFFVIGSNTTEQHPVIGMRIRRAVRERGAKLIVADPRRIPITDFAHLHMQQRPGTDIALINGIAHVLIKNGWIDEEFIRERTEGFEDFKETVMKYPPEVASEITGVPVEKFEEAARILWENRPGALLFAMGITQHTHGVQNVFSCTNLQMLLGNIGKPGAGVNPLRGQNNVQGASDLAVLSNIFPGYKHVMNEDAQRHFSSAWGISLDESLPLHLDKKPGLTIVEIVNAFGEGKIRGLFIMGENPMVSDPDTNHVRECMEKGEFLVVEDIFLTETAQMAHVVLPAASWAEKSGTFTNTERRVQMVNPAVRPPGQARPDWEILSDLANRFLEGEIGQYIDRSAPYASWDYLSPADIMEEIAAVTPIYGGIRYERLGTQGLQWPCPTTDHPGTPILHVGKFTRGKGLFMAVDHMPSAEDVDEEYPLIMTTGRILFHWHTRSMTGRSKPLDEHVPDGFVVIHPEDALKYGIEDGQMTRVTSRRGTVVTKAAVTEEVPPGIVFMTFHWAEENANTLTQQALDPIAKIPEYKVSAVRIEPVR